MSKVFVFALLLGVYFSGFASAQNQPFYSWKDKSGVRHYSDTPPNGVRFESKAFEKSAATSGQEDIGAEEKALSERCESSMQSVHALSQKGVTVMMDLDGDGKPDPLDDATREKQLELAKAQEKAFCS